MKRIFAFFGLLAMAAAVLAGCASSQTGRSIPTEEKKVVEGSGSWAYYTFEDAVEEAKIIVYGTAGEGGEAKRREGADGKSAIDYYHEVPITVKELVKGEGSGTVTYREYGGETADTVYKVLDIKPIETGKDYILFLDEKGYPLPPYTMAPVEDGAVHTTNVPDSVKDEDGRAPESLPIEEYLEMIKNAM